MCLDQIVEFFANTVLREFLENKQVGRLSTAARMRKLITAPVLKNKRTAPMLATARKDHSIPLQFQRDLSAGIMKFLPLDILGVIEFSERIKTLFTVCKYLHKLLFLFFTCNFIKRDTTATYVQ